MPSVIASRTVQFGHAVDDVQHSFAGVLVVQPVDHLEGVARRRGETLDHAVGQGVLKRADQTFEVRPRIVAH
jgi:hypothetical protein